MRCPGRGRSQRMGHERERGARGEDERDRQDLARKRVFPTGAGGGAVHVMGESPEDMSLLYILSLKGVPNGRNELPGFP